MRTPKVWIEMNKKRMVLTIQASESGWLCDGGNASSFSGNQKNHHGDDGDHRETHFHTPFSSFSLFPILYLSWSLPPPPLPLHWISYSHDMITAIEKQTNKIQKKQKSLRNKKKKKKKKQGNLESGCEKRERTFCDVILMGKATRLYGYYAVCVCFEKQSKMANTITSFITSTIKTSYTILLIIYYSETAVTIKDSGMIWERERVMANLKGCSIQKMLLLLI